MLVVDGAGYDPARRARRNTSRACANARRNISAFADASDRAQTSQKESRTDANTNTCACAETLISPAVVRHSSKGKTVARTRCNSAIERRTSNSVARSEVRPRVESNSDTRAECEDKIRCNSRAVGHAAARCGKEKTARHPHAFDHCQPVAVGHSENEIQNASHTYTG